MNVVDAALVEADGVTTPKNTVTALRVLASEVRRLRAAVGAVKALYRLDMYGDVCGIVMIPQDDGQYLDRDDVLRILEGTDGD